MSDLSVTARRGRREPMKVFVVTNPDDSDEEAHDNPQLQPGLYNYNPPPLPETSNDHSPQSEQSSFPAPHHTRPPLTTNLPDQPRNYPSSRSNPTLSSPSSTSSPAIENTPPPSTPAPPVDLSGEALLTSDPPLSTSYPDRADEISVQRREGTTPLRNGNFVDKIKGLSGRVMHRRRQSSNSRPATSPTLSIPEQYIPPAPPSGQTLTSDVVILVTMDTDRLEKVSLPAATNAASIRERIFSRLMIPDEEQKNYSIYRTEIGSFALGAALTEDQMFELCFAEGDVKGSVKFFVSLASAPAHEPSTPYRNYPPPSNVLPPPVVPYSDSYPPLKPNRPKTSKQGSVSSASEPLPLEANGYETSVSDLENADRDHRATLRPTPYQQISPNYISGSPSTHMSVRRADGLPRRPRSPVLAPVRPISPPPTVYRAQIQDKPTAGQRRSVTPTPSPHIPSSPQGLLHDDSRAMTSATHASHGRNGSDKVLDCEIGRERERELERELERDRDRRNNQRRPERRDRTNKDGPLRRQHQKEYGEGSERSNDSGSWVVVPPLSRHLKDKSSVHEPRSPTTHIPRLNQTSGSSSSRYQSSTPTSYSGLHIPRHPQNPPPPTPRTGGQPISSAWPVAWKAEDQKNLDQKPLPPVQNPRLVAKSMDNLRASYNSPHSQHAPPLQPGRPNRNHSALPSVRSGTGSTRDGGASVHFDVSPVGSRQSSSGTTAQKLSALQPAMYSASRPLPIQNTSVSHDMGHSSSTHSSIRLPITGQPGPSSHPGNQGPWRYNDDPYPRPASAFGDRASRTNKPMSPSWIDPDVDMDYLRSPHGQSPRQLYFGPLRSTHSTPSREDPPPLGPLHRQFSSSSANDADLDIYGGSVEHSWRTRSPPRSPNREDSTATVMPDTSTTLTRSESGSNESTEGTLTQAEYGHLAKLVGGDTTLMPKRLLPIPSVEQTRVLSESDDFDGEVYEDDEDEDEDSGLWNKPLTEKAKRPKSILRGPIPRAPALTINTPNAPSLPRNESPGLPPIQKSTYGDPDRIRDKPDGEFSERRKDTWAFRPPAEDVYDRLEKFFPDHDLDREVIEASSGGTSPTAVEHSIPPLPIGVPNRNSKHKKSIRLVAAERKKMIDRTSRMEPLASAGLRRRSTKLWGNKVEEMTPSQTSGSVPSAVPESPPGVSTLKPIFKWVRGELIGKGTYGRVYLALNATNGEMIAVKQVEIPRTDSDKADSRQVTVVEALKFESETLKDLDHPNIVQYLGFEETPDYLSIFLEYVPGGSVGGCLRKHGKFDQEVTKSFTAQILSGLEYLHSKRILHRDLKADNILVDQSGACKISDFGISKRTSDIEALGAFTAMQGSIFWMAPEVVHSQKKGYNAKIDIWSVGCVVLEMWAGRRPWIDQDIMAVMFKLGTSKQAPPVPEDVILTPVADDFRKKCFATDPDERPGATLLLKHPYLTLPPGWVFNGFK